MAHTNKIHPKPFRSDLTNLLERGVVWQATSNYHQPRAKQRSGVVVFGIPAIDQALPGQGLSKGALHEFCFAQQKQIKIPPSILPAFFSTQALNSSTKRIFWIGRSLWPTPYLLLQLAATKTLQQHIFIDPPNEDLLLWAIETTLRSPATAACIAAAPRTSFPISKRLALAAAKNKSIGLLIKTPKEIEASSAATTKWQIEPLRSKHNLPAWNVTLLHCKGTLPPQRTWSVTVANGAQNGDQQTLSLRLLSQMGSKPLSTPANSSYPNYNLNQSQSADRIRLLR